MKLLITIFSLILSLACEAQQISTISTKGYFEVDAISGCYPLTVKITSTVRNRQPECTKERPCQMSFAGEDITHSDQTNKKEFTYTKPGTYQIRVIFQSTGTNEEDWINITVKDKLLPEVKDYPCFANEIKLEVTSKTAYDKYKLVFPNESPDYITVQPGDLHYAGKRKVYPAPIPNPFPEQTVVVSGIYNGGAENCPVVQHKFTPKALPPPFIKELNTELPNAITFKLEETPAITYSIERSINGEKDFINFMPNFQSNTWSTKGDIQKSFYCYRMHAQNPCTHEDIYSNVICTQKFSVEPQSDKNKLNWETSHGKVDQNVDQYKVDHYQITEDSRPMEGDGKVDPPALSFDDLTVDCKNTSTYQLTTIYKNGSKSISYKLDKVKPKLEKRLPPVTNISTVADGHSINLEWALKDPADKGLPAVFSIYKSAANYPNAILATTKGDEPWKFVDDKYIPGTPTCYQIFYKDGCDNLSTETPNACVIQPTLTESPNGPTINWNEYTGFSTLTQYRLVRADETGKMIEEKNTGTATTYKEPEIDKEHFTILYKVIADPAANAGVPPAMSDTLRYNNTPTTLFPTAFTPNGDGLNDTFSAKGLFIAKVAFYVYDRWGNLVYTTDNNEPWNGTRNGTVLPPSVYAWRAEVWDVKGRTKKYSGTVLMLDKENR